MEILSSREDAPLIIHALRNALMNWTTSISSQSPPTDKEDVGHTPTKKVRNKKPKYFTDLKDEQEPLEIDLFLVLGQIDKCKTKRLQVRAMKNQGYGTHRSCCNA